MSGSGWSCSVCSQYVPWGVTHHCGTVAGGMVDYSSQPTVTSLLVQITGLLVGITEALHKLANPPVAVNMGAHLDSFAFGAGAIPHGLLKVELNTETTDVPDSIWSCTAPEIEQETPEMNDTVKALLLHELDERRLARDKTAGAIEAFEIGADYARSEYIEDEAAVAEIAETLLAAGVELPEWPDRVTPFMQERPVASYIKLGLDAMCEAERRNAANVDLDALKNRIVVGLDKAASAGGLH